jgi:endonuclease YncB( thermonuclease family)
MASALWPRVRAKVGIGGVVIGGIIVAAMGFVAASAVSDMSPHIVDTAVGSRFTCTVLSVYDGDGPINCSEVDGKKQPVSVRLRGIEARDADNTCRRADLCPSKSGEEAKAMLTSLAVGRLECVSFGPSYNRVDASCRSATGVDLSCEMIKSGNAMRWPEYDPEERLVHCKPAAGGKKT